MLMLDEERRSYARQDLLEAVLGGLSAPGCAPMPGVLIELLEIAAMERQARLHDGDSRPESCLTADANGSGMVVPVLGKQFIDGARSFARLAARRMFARSVARPSAS